MEIQRTNSRRLLATGESRHGAMIYHMDGKWIVMDAQGAGYEFDSRQEAIGFVDRCTEKKISWAG